MVKVSIRGKSPTIIESYENKENRDKRAKRLKEQGYTIKRKRMTGQTMHPSYIKDYDGEGKDNGFANGIYRTYFPVVYIVEATKEVRLFGVQD